YFGACGWPSRTQAPGECARLPSVKENKNDQQDFSRARRSAHPWHGVRGFGRQQQAPNGPPAAAAAVGHAARGRCPGTRASGQRLRGRRELHRQAECVEVTPRVERTNDKGRGDPGPCSFPSAAVPRPNNIDERASAKIVRLYKIVCSLLRQF